MGKTWRKYSNLSRMPTLVRSSSELHTEPEAHAPPNTPSPSETTEHATELREAFERQVQEAYHKAFYDLLVEKVGSDQPDYEWISRLYGEIREKLTRILRRGSILRTEIESFMDVDLFDQMIRNQAFDPQDLYKLIDFTFAKCKQLGSAGRDEETVAKRQELLDLMNSGTGTFATVVPLYIKNVNFCIDRIYEDLQAFSEKMGNGTKE